jgi:hypothetical protein
MYYNTNTVSEKRKTTNKLKVENEHWTDLKFNEKWLEVKLFPMIINP